MTGCQLIAKIGVCDFDQCFGSLPQALAAQARNAVFGNDVIDAVPGCRHHASRCQRGHDLGPLVAGGGRWQCDDGYAAVGPRRRFDVIETAANAADLHGPESLAVALPLQIDFDRRIDRYEMTYALVRTVRLGTNARG